MLHYRELGQVGRVLDKKTWLLHASHGAIRARMAMRGICI